MIGEVAAEFRSTVSSSDNLMNKCIIPYLVPHKQNSAVESSKYDNKYKNCVQDTQGKAENATVSKTGISNTHQSTSSKESKDILNHQSNETSNVFELGETNARTDGAQDTLEGLFHIGNIKFCNSQHHLLSNTFLVCKPFWLDGALLTEHFMIDNTENNQHLNYLEVSILNIEIIRILADIE